MAYHFAEPDFLSRRALAVSGILALHVVAAYVLATGMLHPVLHDDTPPLIATFTPNPDPPHPAPVPTQTTHFGDPRVPDLPAPRLPAPEPEVPRDDPVTPRIAEAGPAGRGAVVPDALQIIGRNQLPDTQAYYPASAIRDNVQGASLVRVCVDAQGMRRADPLIEQSSGNAQLDASALNVARHGHYARALQSGVAVPNCYQFRINFRIMH